MIYEALSTKFPTCSIANPPKLRRSVKTVGWGVSPVEGGCPINMALTGPVAQAVGAMGIASAMRR